VLRKGAFCGADCPASGTGVNTDSTTGNAAAKATRRTLRLDLENGIFLIPFHAPMLGWPLRRFRTAVWIAELMTIYFFEFVGRRRDRLGSLQPKLPCLPSGVQEYTPLRPQKGPPKFAKKSILPCGSAEFYAPDVLPSIRMEKFFYSRYKYYLLVSGVPQEVK
jgi:hypothetical protein